MATTLTVRLGDRLYEELARIAEAKGVTLSELARNTLGSLVHPGDGLAMQVSPGDAPDTMTTIERHQTALLHRILARLVDGADADGDADYQKSRAEILERGYVGEYRDVFVAIEPELSVRETNLVMDILDMFTQLERSYDRLSPTERASLGEFTDHWVRFGGFDSNHRLEHRLLTYARHLIGDGRWPDLAKYFDRQHDHGNSHSQCLDMYERMLGEFNPIWRAKTREHLPQGSFALTAAELKCVLDAAIHPSNRR